MLKLNTNTNVKEAVYTHSGSDYGIALGNNKVYQALSSGTYSVFDPATSTFTYKNNGFGVLGIATDSAGNVIVGQYGGAGRVYKYAPDGTLIWSSVSQTGGSEVRGVVVDSDDNVWTIHRTSNNIAKYNGTDGTPLGVFPVGNQPYTYSDATGLGLRTSITLTGTWTVIYDSGSAGTSWGRISWNSNVPAGGSIETKTRTAETVDGLQLATYQSVSSGIDFSANGRYIQIEIRLKANPSKESPILYDLTVEQASESSISGMVFDDSNANGAKDSGESGLSRINIQLTRILSPGVESPVSSTVTDANGNYNFMGLISGDYKVEANFSGFARSQTYPAGGTPHFIVFSGSAIGGKDFGAQPIAGGEIRGNKFNDSNSDGIQNPGEESISGVTICLWPSSRCTVTGDSGDYAFVDVPLETQTVYELVPTGYGNTTPTMISVTVNSGDIKTENFGNRKLVPPLPDVIVPGAINENGVPGVFVDNTLVIRKDLSGISGTIIGVKLTLELADGTIKTANMAKLGVTNVWEATLAPSFPSGAARMTFEVDIDPTGPGSEDAIQIGDIVFLDPSGQIRSKCTNAPINGATATLLIESPPNSGNFVPSPAAFQTEPNPQITGEDGKYAWMASAGRYKVRAERDGYVSEESRVVEVPPAVTGLDLELACLNEPPVAVDDTVTTDEDILVTVNVTLNDNDPDGNLNVTSTIITSNPSHGNVVSIGDGKFTYSPNANFNGLDSFTYKICDTAGECDTATVTVNVNPVNDAPVVSIDRTDQTVQYSDGISTVTVSGIDIDTSPLTISTSWNKDGGTEQIGLPGGLTLSSGNCNAGGPPTTCTWTLEGKANVSAGNYNITFKVSDGIDERSKHTILIIKLEDSMITFDDSNPLAVKVAAAGGKSGVFSLKVNVKESMPDLSAILAPFPGDINLAVVSVSLVPVGPGSNVNPASPCSRTVTGTGYDATLTLDCGFNSVEVNTYEVMVSVNGGYYIGSGENVLVVYDPSLGFTTGGGTFLWPETGEKTNFGYTMKYNKKGANIQGSLVLVRHLPDGTIYRVKSNALYGLSLGELSSVGWASFSGKATYLEPGWTDPKGNHEFIVYVEDRNEPGNGIDRFWIRVKGQDGKPIAAMSLNDPSSTNAIALSGGNIVVPHK
ncbi:Serine-aspartate repeat-containing protein D [Methanosarcinales archaeon]|nr:Serine-aspartate repeat-containing protein D [Methanosarcinales archaeon]